MEQGTPMLQVLPQPRTIPPAIIWLIYGAILAGTVIAIIVSSPPHKSSETESSETPTPLENISGYSVVPRCKPKLHQLGGHGNKSVKFQDIAIYECKFCANTKNVTWVCRSDDEISYKDSFGNDVIMNVTDGSSYPRKPHKREISKASLAQRHDSCDSPAINFAAMINLTKYSTTAQTTTTVSAASIVPSQPPKWPRRFEYQPQVATGSRFGNSSSFRSPRKRYSAATAGNFNSSRESREKRNNRDWAVREPTVFIRRKKRLAVNNTIQCTSQSECPKLSTDEQIYRSLGVEEKKLDRRKITQRTRSVSRLKGTLSRQANQVTKRRDVHAILKKHQQRETGSFDAEPSPSVYISKNTFESVRVGESSWLIHTIVQQDKRHKLSLINLAISRADILAQDMDEYDSEWIPDAGDHYRALLPDNQLYVTRILGAHIVDEGHAETYFIAAPVHDFSVRSLYRLQLDFPPLKFSTLGPLSCLTCSRNKTDDNRLGHEPKCDWSEVSLSISFKNYILHCRGSKLPWTAVISMKDNTVIRRLDDNDELRKLRAMIQWPVKHEFSVELQDGSRAKAVLYVPHESNQRKGAKTKLLVRLANHQDDQMVTAKFDVSISTYLVAVEGYAVLSADIRGSKFKSVDYIGMRARRREILQVQDYIRLIHHVFEEFNFIDPHVGFGIFGKEYGGHMALKLIGQDEVLNKINATICYAAVNPVTLWQLYVNPFTIESSSESVRATRREEYINRYLSPMVRKMKNKRFALFRGNVLPEHQLYMDDLKEMMDRHKVDYQYYCYKHPNCTVSQVSLYKQLGAYFKNCLGR